MARRGLYYRENWGEWWARRISVWTTLAFAVPVSFLGLFLVIMALLGKITSS